MFTKSDHIYFPFHPPGTLVGQSGAPFSRGTTEAQELVRGQVSPPSSQADVPSEGTPVGTSGLGVPAAIHTFPEVTAPRQWWGGGGDKGKEKNGGQCGSLGSELDQPWRGGGPQTARGPSDQQILSPGTCTCCRSFPRPHCWHWLCLCSPTRKVVLCQVSRKRAAGSMGVPAGQRQAGTRVLTVTRVFRYVQTPSCQELQPPRAGTQSFVCPASS